MRMELGMGAPMSTDAVLRDMPRPDRVTTPAQFVAALQALRSWAKLTYGELENNAQAFGDRLPRSTIASALSRGHIPREQTISAFVRACGCDEKTVRHWLAVRRRIASADQTVGDLAGAVEKWVAAKWRSRLKDGADLASEVDKWLAGKGRLALQVPRQRRAEDVAVRLHLIDDPLPEPTFGRGRLAEAVEQSTSNRWVGLHRRPARRRIFFARG